MRQGGVWHLRSEVAITCWWRRSVCRCARAKGREGKGAEQKRSERKVKEGRAKEGKERKGKAREGKE